MEPVPRSVSSPGPSALPACSDDVLRRVAAGVARRTAPAGSRVWAPADGLDILIVVLDGRMDCIGPDGQVLRQVGEGAIARQPCDRGAIPVAALRAATDVAWAALDVQPRAVPAAPEPVETLALAMTHVVQRRQLIAQGTALFGTLDEDAVRELEADADWIALEPGDVLIRQGEVGDRLFVLLAGRLEVLDERAGSEPEVVGEVAPGESVGEMSFFLGEPRSNTVRAIRDSLLLCFSNEEFERILARRPSILRQVTKIQAERLLRANRGLRRPPRVTNVAVLPLAPDVPLAAFCRRLAAALTPLGRTRHLAPAAVNEAIHDQDVAEAPEGSAEELRLLAWLARQESEFRFVVYEADPARPRWARRCLHQADRVLLVAHAAGRPDPGEVERKFLGECGSAASARQALVLLHPDGSRLPSGTRRWLAPRAVQEHHHVRWDRDDDLARVARFLAGRAIGLALGGGGARGFAHIGIVRALAETGVPVDMVAGTSMGAGMAAQTAMGWTPERMLETARRVWIEIQPHKEYTFPLLSFVRSDGAERCGRMMYGDTHIEDLWTPFCCVSSNLTDASLKVHRTGPLLHAVTASSSLPGVVVPVLDAGQLLVDGALFDNLPGDVLRNLGCGRVVASRVSVAQDESFRYERIPTLREVLRAKLRRRRREPLRYPGLFEVVMRAAMLASINRENAVSRGADFLFRPPIEPFGLMEFTALDAIAEAGYAHAVERLEAWRAEGRLAELTPARAAEVA